MWLELGGKNHYYRSKWEANYARYLEWQRKNGYIHDWFPEPQTFWFKSIQRGVRSYLPDFKVIKNDLSHYWVEVKGYMDQKSKTKIKRFHKYYPSERLDVIEGKWFKKNNAKMKLLIKTWD